MNTPSTHSINFITNKNERKNSIIYIFWNDWFTNNRKYNNNFNFANELMAFTNSCSNSNLNHNFNKIITYNLEEAIDLASDAGFPYAIVQTPGHVIMSNFDSTIRDYLWSINTDWSVIGHILNFKKYNSWLTLHDQCFVLNLKHVNFVGSNIGYPDKGVRLFPDYTPSEENFHDDYTPKTIEFNEKYFRTGGYGLGWKWLSYGLINNSIRTFNNDIRNKKIHLYPENPGNQEAWYNENSVSDENQLKKIVKQFKVSDPRQHVFNNENVFPGLPNIIKDKIENVVVAASGFYGMQVSKLLNAKNVYYYDQDLSLLNFRERLNLEWNGKDPIHNYYSKDMIVFNENALPRINAIDGHIIKDQNDFDLYFQEFRRLPKFYQQVNIINEWEKFYNFIPKDGSTYIWLDSIYTYWYNLWHFRPSLIQNSFISLIHKLQSKKDPIWINVKEPSGQYRIFEVHNYCSDSLQMLFSRYEHFS